MKAGETIVLCFHAKTQPERPPSGASRPRLAGLGVPPHGHRPLDNGSDLPLEMVDSCVGFTLACARPAGLGEAGPPPSGPSRPLVLLMLHSAFVHCPGKWVAGLLWILGCLVAFWTNVNAFRCIQLNRGPTLDSKPHECALFPLD